MRHVGKVLGILGAVGAGTAAVAHVVRRRAHRVDAEKAVDDAFAALPRLDLRDGLAAYSARNDNAVRGDDIAAVDRRMARRAHAHVSRDPHRKSSTKNADPMSAAYAAMIGDATMSPAAATMVDEADAYVDEFLDDEVMVLDDAMLDDMMVGDATYDDSLVDEVMFGDAEAMTPAGTMFVGAVDEVELGAPFRSGDDPLAFDPEEVPSEHAEINELRSKMPFG